MKSSVKGKIAEILVRYRLVLLGLMVAASVGSVFLVPRININSDMTEYLPSDSAMREGLDSMRVAFPSVDINAFWIKVMFHKLENPDSTAAELLEFDGIDALSSTLEKDGYTLFQFTTDPGTDPKETVASIREHYGDAAVAETNANSIMPDNMVPILIIGVVLIFGILFLMCSSFVEALLFIVTIGLAVVINMGTNAFLPSVSMLTNTISAVLQLVLSMDYSIILMNRYRQERELIQDPVKAMSGALASATPSILSSSLTTIAGLLALVFMKFKIGMDLGLVLAKGVFTCLVSIYTILPALVLLFEKAVRATEKKVFLMPTDRLSRFEMRFRIPLAILFVSLFAGAWFLHNRTVLSYASIWESEISDVFPPQNTCMLLFDTADEQLMTSLVQEVADDSLVSMAISYPSLMLKKMDADEMFSFACELSSQLPDSVRTKLDAYMSADMLKLLYYACTHPERNEKMSFDDIQAVAEDESVSSLIPDGLDFDALVQKYTAMFTAPAVEPAPAPAPSAPEPALPEPVLRDLAPVPADGGMLADTSALVASARADTLVSPVFADSAAVDGIPASKSKSRPVSRYTYENSTRQLTANEMSEFLGFDALQAKAIYKLSGRKASVETMSPHEFLSYVSDHVLTRKLYKKVISSSQEAQLKHTKHLVDSVVREGPSALPEVVFLSAQSQSHVPENEPADVQSADTLTVIAQAPAVEPLSVAAPAPEPAPTPLDRLLDMVSSGRKYSSSRIKTAMRSAGIDIDPAYVDLLFLYYGCKSSYDSATRLSLKDILDYLTGSFLSDPTFAPVLDDSSRLALEGLDSQLAEGMGQLRTGSFSMAVFITDYPQEAPETYGFVERLQKLFDRNLPGKHYLIGESVMYKEMKDGFQQELTSLTLITVFVIFLIVALTFRSLIIPTLLVLTVLTGVYVNVFVSGLGGRTMLYLAYLIVQSILMGASIDYGILFTNYYREKRRSFGVADALREAYRGSIHTIMTSGLIIVCAPYIMSVLLTDPTISSILSSLTYGALATLIVILFVYPALLAVLDRFIVRNR